MKYYVTSDVHGFYTPLREALANAGYFDDDAPHKLLIAGDLFDRGGEANALQDFILDLMDRDAVILIRGNHEDLYEELVTEDRGLPYRHHVSNGTYDTALQLTGIERDRALAAPISFAKAARETPYYQKILPAMIDYYETKEFIFTHGWIPCVADGNGGLAYIGDWRDAPRQMWRQARWLNGMDAVRMVSEEGKTIVCGHWHTSYGHSKYEGKGSELGADADFSPYSAPGIIALDACTARSGIVNCIVVEDDEQQ